MSTSQVAVVAVLSTFPRNIGIFDYSVPLDLPVKTGDLVEVPFRGLSKAAIVIKIKLAGVSRYKLKTLNKVLLAEVISQEQLLLMEWLAQETATSLSTVLKLAARVIPNKLADEYKIKKNKFARTVIQPINIVTFSSSQSDEVVFQLVARVIGRGQQVLLLVPEIHLINHWQDTLSTHGNIAVITGKEKISYLRSIWEQIRSGKIKIIIGTSSALWFNYSSLGAIILTQAENSSYFQTEKNPRYDTTAVAKKLANLHQAALAKISYAPRLEWWQLSLIGREKIKLLPAKVVPCKVIITNKRNTTYNQLLSDDAVNQISETLLKQGRVFLYLNKRGDAAGCVCHDCGFSPVCEICDRRLALVAQQNELICWHCQKIYPLPIPCPKCGGLQTDYYGGGISKLVEEAKRIWPKYKIKSVEGAIKDISFNRFDAFDIIIGNQTAIRSLAFTKLDLIVMVSIDSLLALPEFRVVEHCWQLIKYLLSHTRSLIIQTQIPNHYLWSSLSSKEFLNFYSLEYNLRQKFNYPPALGLTRLSCQSDTQTKCLHLAEDLERLCKSEMPSYFEISSPYPDYYRIKNKNWRYHILIKHPAKINMSEYLNRLPSSVVVERDPWFIFS